MSERKLATIRRVVDLRPIEGADKIELAIVDGWQTVVQKGAFKVGDPAIYFEIDSFLPADPRFAFLKERCLKVIYNKPGYRLKTIRLKKMLSQGLLMPMSEFPEVGTQSIGSDVTEQLGVVKYESPLPTCLVALAKGNFPSFLRKTDQERIQNCVQLVQGKDMLYEITEKLNGTSATFYMKDKVIGVCSRNLDLKESVNSAYWIIYHAEHIKDKLEFLGRNIAIQGEIVGPSICGNDYGLHMLRYYIFDVYDIDLHRLLIPSERMALLDEMAKSGYVSLHVPVIAQEKFHSIDDSLKLATGRSIINPNVRKEGIVYKSISLVNYEVSSFKVLNNEHLLEEVD